MTTSERVQAVVDHGFTERQARFLVLVMRHAGVCVKRQYATFAGIANGGEKCNAFFAKLVRRGYAVPTACVHSRARLYHVHHKPLYHAIGEADSRYRRTVPARAVAERLMRLDAALLSPGCEWLTNRLEKLMYLDAKMAPTAATAPPGATTIHAKQDVADLLPGTFPIGVDQRGSILLLYLATVPWADDFRSFLVGHTALLSVAPSWLLRVVFSPSVRRVVPDYERAVREELESPLDGETIRRLRHWFFHRRRHTDLQAIPEGLRAMLKGYERAFAGPRFAHLYRRWLKDEDAALTPIPSAIPEALAAGRGAIESVVLPHAYDHLSPLVGRDRPHHRRHTADAEGGAETPRRINPSINPVP